MLLNIDVAGKIRQPVLDGCQHNIALLPAHSALRYVIQLGANIPPPARHSEIFGKHMKGLIFLGTTAFVV
jgi:hypothetical protein